jgi:hypothetical protein
MAIDRYNRYGEPRLAVVDDGAYLIRDVLREDGRFSGICEYGVYGWDGEVEWTICREGVEFREIRPFLPTRNIMK